ncbi:MAG: hypothetical protein BJ554DRAFT_5461, partial [Olpidium bornovanus]
KSPSAPLSLHSAAALETAEEPNLLQRDAAGRRASSHQSGTGPKSPAPSLQDLRGATAESLVEGAFRRRGR